MSYPKNADEWWSLVDKYWDNLYNILVSFVSKDELSKADDLRLEKDKKLADLFQKAWSNAPDSYRIHSIPNWHTLCDLCSESYVLYEEEESNEQLG